MSKPIILLVRPQLAENIGAVARVMANFGLEQLRVVAPRDGWPQESASAMAAGADSILEQAQVYPDLASALADVHLVLATGGRQYGQQKPILTPEVAATRMLATSDAGGRVALLFGPERAGLTGDDLSVADAQVFIPVDADFPSLNIAQAVAVCAYEWFKQSARDNVMLPAEQAFVPAQKMQLLALFDFLESELTRINYFRPLAKKSTMVRNLRNILHRLGMNDQDVRTIFGVLQALVRGKMPL